MKNQQLFYRRVTPISQQRHGDWSIEAVGGYDFAKMANSVPVMAAEMALAAREYAVVFAGSDEAIMPVLLLGLEGNDNAYVKEDGSWNGKYVPAFVRRYPFVFSLSEDGKQFTLCIDESWSGCNEEGRGSRLFDEQGERTEYLENVLKFLQEYQVQFNRTKAFCNKLKELGLLEPMQAEFTLANGEKRSLVGFMAVSRDKLKALPADTLAELAQTDELELAYAHLQSMNNITAMGEMYAQHKGVTRNNARNVDKSAASKTASAAEEALTQS